MPAVTRGDELELTVDSLAYGGRGVARHGELVVFVARALPGDRVRARVTKYKRRYAEARAVELLEAGPGRVEAPCPHFGVCGGCAWQDLEYARQLEHKQAQVVDALERLGRLEGYELLPIEPAVAAVRLPQQARVLVVVGAGRPLARLPRRRPLGPAAADRPLPDRRRSEQPRPRGVPSAGRGRPAPSRTTSARAPASCATW